MTCFECKSLPSSKRWKGNGHEQEPVSLQPVRCLPIRPYVPCCQSPELLETEHRVHSFPLSHTHTLQHTQHTMTFPFRRLPFSSPFPHSYLLTTTTGPDLFPKDLFLAMFPAPWKHILVSGAYPQRKGQT